MLVRHPPKNPDSSNPSEAKRQMKKTLLIDASSLLVASQVVGQLTVSRSVCLSVGQLVGWSVG